MADEEVDKILDDLGLSNLIDTFKNERITIKVLENLTPSLIQDLIPTIGERVIFMEYWKEQFGKSKSDRKVHERSCPNSDESSTKKIRKTDLQAAIDSLDENDFGINSTKNLIELLNSNKDGQLIRDAIQSDDEKLREHYRGKLCSIIISDLHERNIKMTNDIARDYAKQIQNTFPSESITTYFKSPVFKKDTKNNKSKIARGKLVYAWRNRKYKENQVKKIIEKQEPSTKNILLDQSEDDDYKDVEWLKNNQAPWDVVTNKWQKTSKFRCKQLRDSEDTNLSNIFNSWHLYSHPHGHTLIDIDFYNLNISNVDLNNDVWNEFYDTIKTVSYVSSQDKTGKTLLQKLEQQNLSNDSKIAVDLSLLAHLFVPKQMKSVNKHFFKPSIGLAKKGMLQVAEISGEMSRIRTEVKSKATDLKLTVQPYIIIIGAEDNVNEVFVNIDDTLYKVEGMLKAIDICFKVFHVFNLQYPLVSEHLWLLIQKGIYRIDLPFDEHITSIQHVLNVLKHKNSKTESNEEIVEEVDIESAEKGENDP